MDPNFECLHIRCSTLLQCDSNAEKQVQNEPNPGTLKRLVGVIVASTEL